MPAQGSRPNRLPLWLKIVYSLFVAILVPVYWRHYGAQNFLWFSDIALFLTLAALWLESSLLASMMTLAVLLPEIVWNIGFFTRLVSGIPMFGLTDYMFDPARPLFLRALSLFHVFLPPILIWLVWRLGYDRRALLLQTLLAAAVLPLTYLLTDPAENINWTRGLAGEQNYFHPLAHLVILMVLFPALIYLPTHVLLVALLPREKLHHATWPWRHRSAPSSDPGAA